jgi:hypothetical protein
MSVQYLGMTGAKCIQEAQTTRIKFDGKVTIAKTGTNKDGFVLKGATADGPDKDLLSVYHNDTGLDAINYKGKQDSETNLATVGYVDNAVGSASQSANIVSYFQIKGAGLDEGCFNMLDIGGRVCSKSKDARFLEYHIIEGFEDCEWMGYDLTGKGQIHLTSMDGKIHLSKFITGASRRDGETGGDATTGAVWTFDLEEYGHTNDQTLSGNYFLQFDRCLREPS